MTRTAPTGGTPAADGPRLQSSPAPSVNDVPRRPSGRVVASKASSRTLSEDQLQRLATLVANEIRGAMAVALMALGEAGERLAAMQMPETIPEQEGSLLPIERAAAVLASAPKPISSGELAEAIGIKRASWAKYATRALKDGRFERRYPEGLARNGLWWRPGGSEGAWSQAMEAWQAKQRKAFRAGARTRNKVSAEERRAFIIASAERILSKASRPLSTRELADKVGVSPDAVNKCAKSGLPADRIERRFPARMNSYARWWRPGGSEAVWDEVLDEAAGQRCATLLRGNKLQGLPRDDGWPRLDPKWVIEARHRRWEREKPFAADTLTFKRGPVMDFTRRMPSTQSFSGTAAALAAEAA